MNCNILIVGNGFVGANLFDYYQDKYNVDITTKEMLDVCCEKSIQTYFKNNKDKYTHIIYAAGLKDVSYCEKNPEEAFAINAESVKRLLRHTEGTQFIYISTDYVFSGLSGNYDELSVTDPRTVYGKSKLLGEWYCEMFSQNFMIVRTSGIYGANCGWLQWLRGELDSTEEIVCFEDAHNSPTYVDNLGEMIIEMIKCGFSGHINLSGPEKLNRYELYKKVFTHYNSDTSRLLPGSSKGAMPYDVSLSNNLYTELTDKNPWSVEKGLRDLSQKEKS